MAFWSFFEQIVSPEAWISGQKILSSPLHRSEKPIPPSNPNKNKALRRIRFLPEVGG